RLSSLAGIDRAYFWICGFIIALALLFVVFRKVVTDAAPPPSQEIARRGFIAVIRDALSSRWALLGGLAIFLYVGAEVAIGTQMAFFLHSDAIWGRSDAAFAYPLIGHIMGNDGLFGVAAARRIHRHGLPDVPLRAGHRRRQRGRGGALHRPVQFDHVPGHLHPYA